MNPGDFVRHSRQGPGRITQIFPDYVEVKAAAGHLFNVNRDLIKFELEKFPPDGFVALLATRHPSSDFLLENIVDVALRIFRDHRKSSLPQKEFRLALEPFVRRDGKSYASWWKRAKPKLLATGSVIPHPKKKTSLALAKEFTSESSMDWEAELENIKSDAALLDYARRLFASDADNNRASMAAANALERAVRELHASEEHSHARLERPGHGASEGGEGRSKTSTREDRSCFYACCRGASGRFAGWPSHPRSPSLPRWRLASLRPRPIRAARPRLLGRRATSAASR